MKVRFWDPDKGGHGSSIHFIALTGRTEVCVARSVTVQVALLRLSVLKCAQELTQVFT